MFEKTIPVLMYHRLTASNQGSSLSVSPATFAKHLEWLERKNFQFLSLDEVLQRKRKVAPGERAVALTFDDGFQDNWEGAFSLLVKQKKPAALFVIVNWVGQPGFLNWKEIRELSRSGVAVGSHSLTHRWLPDFKDEKELRAEIFDSKKRLEDELGCEVSHFSYPVGGVDERVARLVSEAGYRAAWAAGARPKMVKLAEPFCLRRVKISPSDAHLTRFAVKAYGFKSWFW